MALDQCKNKQQSPFKTITNVIILGSSGFLDGSNVPS